MNSVFCFDEFELDSGAFTLHHLGEAVRVDVVVLRVLQALVRSSGQLLSKEQLIAEVWNGRVVSDNALTVAVSRLRKLLRERGMPRNGVLTAHGHGYRFTRTVSSHNRELEAAAVFEPRDPDFVGRAELMQQLRDALAEAQHGYGRLVVMRGEAGVGKTRAAEVFAEHCVHAGCAVAWARCRESTAMTPLWPFVELLRELASTQSSAGMSALPPESTGLTTQAGGSRQQLFEAIAHLLGEKANGTTRVLILDDLPNVDETSLQLLRYLLPILGRMHVLVLATLQGEYSDAVSNMPLLAALAHRNCLRITLGPLSESAVKRYIVARVGAAEDALSHRIYELSEGNPYSMVELVRQLRDNRSTPFAGELSLPERTRELMRQRLAALDDDDRAVLSYAAVIGRGFGLPLLAAVVGRSAVTLMATLDSASAAKIVQTVADSRTEFTFAHGMLRTALYDAQSATQRRMRHLHVARILEQRRALAEASDAEIAYHVRSSLPPQGLPAAPLLRIACELGARRWARRVRSRRFSPSLSGCRQGVVRKTI